MMSLDLGFFALPEAGFEANMAKSKKHVTPEEWWSTSIIEMEPGVIRYCGYAIEDLIGGVGFVNMIWLLTRGDLPQPAERSFLKRLSWPRSITVPRRRPSRSRAWP